jgi:hypothetical protein
LEAQASLSEIRGKNVAMHNENINELVFLALSLKPPKSIREASTKIEV